MQAIVFANRCGEELSPLHAHLCPALLPVANKPVIEHCLDELTLNAVYELFVVVDADHLAAIRALLEDGCRWSVQIHYILCRDGEHPDSVRRRLGSKLRPPYLALRADMLRGQHCWSAANRPATAWVDTSGRSIGVQHVLTEPCTLDPIDWPLHRPTKPIKTQVVKTERLLSALDSLEEYHRAALQAATDALPVAARGLRQGVSLRTGLQSRIHHRSVVDGAATLGDFSNVHSEARLSGQTAIGNHCVIDRGARLHNSVVLDHTYVGAGVTLENAIAYGNHILRIDLRADLSVDEPFLLADCRPKTSAPLIDRLLGVTLLLLSLPLWLLAAAWAWFSRSDHRLTRPDRAAALLPDSPLSWQWNLPLPSLAKLPRLIAVCSGHLHLVGRSPDQPIDIANDSQRPWLPHYQQLPIGLLSPARWLLPRNVSAEIVELTELELHNRGLVAALRTRYAQRRRPKRPM